MPDPSPTAEPTSPGTPAVVAHHRAVIGLIAALAVASCLAVAVASGSHVLDGFDTGLTDVTRGWADPLGWPVDVVHVIGLVTAPFWSALAATALVVALLLTHHRAAAGLLAMSGIAGVTVSETVKMSMGRARPPGAEQFEPDLNKSFPSGHAMEGIYLYLATGLVLIHLGRAQGRRWMQVVGRILVVVGPLIGLSRLVLGVHWPSDVIAGWALGSVVLLTSALILWWPLDRGWARHGSLPTAATPPLLPGADTTPAPPAR
jgi:membrane-associated phospholipid phosphatase